MNTHFVLFMLLAIASCGKVERKERKNLNMSALQASGINLGTDYDEYGRKMLVVLCEEDGFTTNSQRISQLISFKSSNSSMSEYSIVGSRVSPSQMNALLDQAIQNLQRDSYSEWCPSSYYSDYLAEIYL